MPETFDAYHKWLGIPASEQPPNCYRLLGIALFESDPDVIATATDKQMAHIRSFQTGKYSALSQRILNEIAAARICLLNAAKKADYDEHLRGQLATSESQPQQTETFDPSQLGIDLTAPKSPPVVKQPRRSYGTKLPWQLPAAIAAGLLASVAIIAYLLSKPPEGEKPAMQAKADTPSKKAAEDAKPNEKKPPQLESPKPEPEPPKVEPKPDPKPPKPEPQPEFKPDPQPKPEPKPEPDPPEEVAKRVKDAFGKAKSPADFRTVAVDAVKLIDQANPAGKRDVAKSVVTLALTAARKADDDELAKTATMCILEPDTKPAKESSLDQRDTTTADQRKPRLPIPDASAQEQALKLVRDVFKDKYSATTSGTLAQDLLQKAQSTNDDSAGQYVMLKEAGRFAIQAKDADLAFQVIEEMGSRFEINSFDLKVASVTAMCKSIRTNEQSSAVVDGLLALMEEAVTREKFDAAKQLGSTATDLARKSKVWALLTETVARQNAITKGMVEIQKAQAELTEALDALDENPIDPVANLAVGKYRCFVQGKWNKGISMLALGDDLALKNLAVKELKGITDAAEQTKVGDAWWNLGEKKNGLAKKNLQKHAASWYEQALPGLTGLVKEKVEKRLAQHAAVIHDDEVRRKHIDKVLIWNEHNGGWNNSGTKVCNVALLRGGREVWRANNVSLPWIQNEDVFLSLQIPHVYATTVRVEVVEWRDTSGGLAEVQVFSGKENIAKGCRVTASEEAPVPGDRRSALTLTDGITTSAKEGEGYWLLPVRSRGWAEIHLSE